jgi:hypothetical protein
MGISSDGIVNFGWPLGEVDSYDNEVFPQEWFDEDESIRDVFDEKVLELCGVVRPDHKDYDKQEWTDYFAAKREAEETFPLQMDSYCSYDYPMYFLAVRGVQHRAYRGDAVELKFPAISYGRILATLEAAKKLGITLPDVDPKWYVYSMYG